MAITFSDHRQQQIDGVKVVALYRGNPDHGVGVHGVCLWPGDTMSVSPNDARYLVSIKSCAYADDETVKKIRDEVREAEAQRA